ncbi:MAG: hypothetical protein HUU16_14740 [Candidatus Omnitrophica bacterium]|nr:hypothetical protein [bacterium]NUN97417.1 hypothetical protein [Candidatus Omnitrophota bacterium]
MQPIKDALPKPPASVQSPWPLVSATLADGTLIETLYRSDPAETSFCVFKDGSWSNEPDIVIGGKRYVPYSPSNNLLKHEVVLFPSEPEGYGTEEDLIASIRAYVHRYVDLSPLFEQIAAYYVLFSWVYDAFGELPYLRVRGDYGSGKTRFLLITGSLCYKPIFASGASTISPLFRILDAFKGTLILDEADFRMSDERAEIVKILNNGNVKGFPVLRSEVTRDKEFKPTAFSVFGPKIVATRGDYQDPALESRFLKEDLGTRPLREDIPINLPPGYKEEALHLRNQLLLFRFKNRTKRRIVEGLIDRSIEPRLNQIFIPLLSIIEDGQAREDLQDLARAYNTELVTDRGMDMEAQVLQVIRDLREAGEPLSLKAITSWFADRHAEEYDRKITPKWIGYVIRKKLHLKTYKSDGVFVIQPDQKPVLERLFRKYGVGEDEAPSRDFRDVRDFGEGMGTGEGSNHGSVNHLGY